ncbi:MAG: alpha/beta fold hydrolase [Gammaproteobacteria bacterium]
MKTARNEMVIKVPALVLAPLRLYFQVAARVLPAAAVGAFTWLLSHMPRKPLSQRDRDFLATAKRIDLPCDGAVLAGYSFGEGPLVLMVHGLQGSAANFHAMIPALVAAGYRVVAFDSVNHSNSPAGTAFSNNSIRHLRQVIAQLGELHAIISHSAGAYLTMMALLDCPPNASVRKCVYLAPYPDIGVTLRTFTDYFWVPARVMPQLRRWFEQIGQRPFEQQSMRDCLPRHRTPALPQRLFIHDRDDRHIPLHHTEQMLVGIEQARLHVTEGLGHFRILKDRAVLEQIVAFLGQSDGTPP